MSELDKMFAQMSAESAEAEDTACDFWIDEDLRVVAIPEKGVVLGVEGDRDVNRVRFRMNRVWRGNDMSKFDLRINYENANGDKNFYDVKNKFVDGDILVFDWIVAADAVAYQGDVWFIVVGLVTNSGTVKQAFHTTLGKAKCLEGLVVDTKVDIPEIRDFMATLKAEVQAYGQSYVDASAASAKAAKNSETAAAASAKNAKTSETNAEASAGTAKTAEANAGKSASAAQTSAAKAESERSAAETARAEAERQAKAAAGSAEKAEGSADSAAGSAAKAEAAQTKAENQADRAEANASAATETAEELKDYYDGVKDLVDNTLQDYTGGYYRSYEAVVPADGWQKLDEPVGRFWYFCDVAIEGCSSALVPMGTLTLDEAGETEKANFATVVQTVEGGVRFFAAAPVSVDMRVLMTLFAQGTASMTKASEEEVDAVLDEIFNS